MRTWRTRGHPRWLRVRRPRRCVLSLPADERRRLVLESLAAYFGEQALDPVAYYESPWMHEDWTAGAYGTSFDLGSLTRYGPHLRQDVGPISFVSSDVAGLGFQHVDGAIRMGEDVAMRITATLPDRGPMLCRSIERHTS